MTSQTVLPRAALALVVAAALPLTGCNQEKQPAQAAAAGEILPRSVTDDMLPYDTVRSQASPAAPAAMESGTSTDRRPAATGADANGSTAADSAADDAGAQSDPVTPAAE